MIRTLRVLLFLLCILGALSAGEVLSYIATETARSYPLEQTRLALDALFAYFVTPIRVILILLGLAVLLAPRAVATLRTKRIFSPPHPASNRWFLPFALLFCFSSALALNIAAFRNCKITPDENTYLSQGRIFAQGKLYGEAPPVPEFFEEPYLAHKDGRVFSIYQPGWSALLAPGILLGIEQAIPPLAATLALLAVFFLAKRLYGSGTGRAAVLVMLFSPYFLFHGATYYSHIAELLWIACFSLSFVIARQEKKDVHYLTAGLCLAAAFLTRHFDLVFGLPFGLLLVWDVLSRRESAWKNVFRFVSPLFAAAGITLAYQWILTGHPLLAAHEIYIAQSRYIYILSQLEDPYRIYGFGADYPFSVAMTRMLKKLWQLNFWVFPLALVFLFPVLVRPKRWEVVFLCAFLCLVLVYLPYFPPGGWQYGPRYYFPAFGCLALLIARGMEQTFHYVRTRWGKHTAYRGLAYWLCFCLVFNLSSILFIGTSMRLVARGALDSYRLLEQEGVEAGVVFLTMHPDFYAHESDKDPNKEAQLRKDFPYYLIHNRADYRQALLFAHSLGEEEDPRIMETFPDRPFYVFRANPFAAAFGIGSGELERIRGPQTAGGK